MPDAPLLLHPPVNRQEKRPSRPGVAGSLLTGTRLSDNLSGMKTKTITAREVQKHWKRCTSQLAPDVRLAVTHRGKVKLFMTAPASPGQSIRAKIKRIHKEAKERTRHLSPAAGQRIIRDILEGA
jgi:hypothetical protein